MKVDQFPDRIIQIKNENFLYFGGTAYLGLPTHLEFQNTLIKNILKWGTAYGSSRNANVKLSIYDDCEKYLANFIQSEASVTISSGMLAGKLVIEKLELENDCFFHFPNIHNAICSKNSLPFYIDNEINPRLLDSKKEKIVVLSDGIPSFTVVPSDFSDIEKISNSKEITLVIDESHSFGIYGNDGSGIFSSLHFPNIKRKIMVSSLGKAIGLTGGIIASDFDFINEIKYQNSFISGAGMNAAFVQTIFDAKTIFQEQILKLRVNLKFLDLNINKKENFIFNEFYPLIYPKIENINKILEDEKIIITNFKYSKETQDLNRIVITANHTTEDLEKLVKVLNKL
jgi:7-keto-8-aminopelargonate synthetase-like enzyme